MNSLPKNDKALISILQKNGARSVGELSETMGVTETAIRQRLSRLIASELISREEVRVSRGRPVHKYSLTKKGRQSGGQNFFDLASVVWEEIRLIEDVTVRSRIIDGIAKRLADKYRSEIDDSHLKMSSSDSPNQILENRAKAIAEFFENRGIPVTLENLSEPTVAGEKAESSPSSSRMLPVINLHGCPYPGLSEEDGLICEMEQAMFSELAGCDIELQRCGTSNNSQCCTFQMESGEIEPTPQNEKDPQQV